MNNIDIYILILYILYYIVYEKPNFYTPYSTVEWKRYSDEFKINRHNTKKDDLIQLADSVTEIATIIFNFNNTLNFIDLWNYVCHYGRDISFNVSDVMDKYQLMSSSDDIIMKNYSHVTIYFYDLWRQNFKQHKVNYIYKIIQKINLININVDYVAIYNKILDKVYFGYVKPKLLNRELPLVITDERIKSLLEQNNESMYKHPSNMGELIKSYNNAYRHLYNDGQDQNANYLRSYVYTMKRIYNTEGRKSKKRGKRRSMSNVKK